MLFTVGAVMDPTMSRIVAANSKKVPKWLMSERRPIVALALLVWLEGFRSGRGTELDWWSRGNNFVFVALGVYQR